ncbi:MAG: AsmA-like C-terminal region-containing protein [Thermoguttaceae bacterium]
MLALVVGAASALAIYTRLNDELRCRIEKLVADHYQAQGLKVRLGSAELLDGKGIRLRNLSIVEPGADGPRPELFWTEEILLECTTDLKELLQHNPDVRRVTIRRPTLYMTRRPDGHWSATKLLPPPHFGDHPPPVTVEGGAIELFDPQKSPAGALVLRDVGLSLTPADVVGDSRQLQGTFSGDGFRRVEVKGSVDLQAGSYVLNGRAEAIDVSPELRDSLPGCWTEKLRRLPDVRGQANFQFEIGYDPKAATPFRFATTTRLTRGQVTDPRLPRILTDVRATLHVDNAGYLIEDFSARSGEATLRMALRSEGFESNSPMRLAAEIRQFELDRALLDVLPDWAQDQWYKFRPSGTISADVKLAFDGARWHPEASVQCLNVSLTHHKFQYRLEHGRGQIDVKDDKLQMSLTAYTGSRSVRLSAAVDHPFSHEPTGQFEATGDDIPLDESLIAALPEKPRKVVRSLNPAGTVNFYVSLSRQQPGQPLQTRLQVAANRCAIRYEKFPYPLSNIRGRLEMFNNQWNFCDLEATNDHARITCNGSLTPGLQGNELVLNFKGRDVALDENLRDALLNQNTQQLWLNLRPRGVIDLTAQVSYLVDDGKFRVQVQAQPQPQNTSIEPVHFPYRLDRLEGNFAYRDGHVEFDRCKAEHGDVQVAAKGRCDVSPDGRWTLHFDELTADRLRFDRDRDLLQALPERLRKALFELRPTGTINLGGAFELERTGQVDEPLHSWWKVRLGLHQSNLQCGGLLLENLHGVVSLVGKSDGLQVRSRGWLDLDSVRFKECQLSQVRGPIWIDDGRVLFGRWVDRLEGQAAALAPDLGPPQTPQLVTAGLFGGTLLADGWVQFGPEPRYGVNATLKDGDMARCSRETGSGHPDLRGKINATTDLRGAGSNRNTLAGNGTLSLSDGDVNQLPLMVSLLKLLGIRTSQQNQNAYSNSSVQYRIEGEHIYLERIEYHGDAFSLRGSGEMDFQSTIRMTLYATVGRGELDLPVVKQVFTSASQQIMLIHVDGTLQNPETRKEALPTVNRAIQTLRDELK